MIRIHLLFLLFCYSINASASIQAKDTLVADFDHLPSAVDLRPYVMSLEDKGGLLTPQQIASASFNHNYHLFHVEKKHIGKGNNCWLKLHVKNAGSHDSVLTLFTGWHDNMSWYVQDTIGYRLRLLMQTGLMKDHGNVQRWEHYGFNVAVPPGQTRTFFLHINNKYYNENGLMPVLFNALQYGQFRSGQMEYFRGETILIHVLLGMLLVCLAIAVINYIQLTDKSYK